MSTPVSPKVTASAVAGLIAAALLANVTLITPDLFAGLGKWSSLVYGLVITLAVTTAGWLKYDPLRATAQLGDPTTTTSADTVTILQSGPVPSGVVPDLPPDVPVMTTNADPADGGKPGVIYTVPPAVVPDGPVSEVPVVTPAQ